MVTLYHGTTESRGKKIIQEGKINCNATRLYSKSYQDVLNNNMTVSPGLIKPKSLSSTPGYVYCTNDLIYAIYYGNKNALMNNEEKFYVFKFNIPEKQLEPDEDEVRMVLMKDINDYPTAQDTLKACKSARYADSITDYSYFCLPTTMSCDERAILVSKIVKEYNYNEEKSDEHKKKYIRELLCELEKIIIWEN